MQVGRKGRQTQDGQSPGGNRAGDRARLAQVPCWHFGSRSRDEYPQGSAWALGPGGKAMSAIASDPLRGLSSTILGKRSADQEIEASIAKVKSFIPRVLPTMAGVYTQSVARALFAPRAIRFAPKSHAIERVSWGTIAVMN
jgi:hypothetical protein